MRHRVSGYRIGDLEQAYPDLDLEEDYLYAHGFMPREIWQLLYPRDKKADLDDLACQVLAKVQKLGELHPRDLDKYFGYERVVGGWGNNSKASKQALGILHRQGLLRVIRREKGIRVYAPMPDFGQSLSPEERWQQVVLLVADIFAPTPERSLKTVLGPLRRRYFPDNLSASITLKELLQKGELERHKIEGLDYLWPSADKLATDVPEQVRLLAPFDPLVWDRARFEHLWGWRYRFEAYVPATQRVRGYYAMPLLWRDEIIGWANVGAKKDLLDVEVGFVDKKPREKNFTEEFDGEIERMKEFLNLK